jgi:hypothetical protein
MTKNVFLLFLLSFFFTSFSAFSLEIDERLTLRIVKISESKKTILINRGIEDGIVKGDHAKFFLTVGVVSRGVVVKVSPTRSVWSLYRLVNAEYIRDDQVMRLKITAPVKITKDESRMLVADDSVVSVNRDPRDLGIPLADGAEDENNSGKLGLDGEALRSKISDLDETVSLREMNKEFFMTFHYSGSNFITAPSNDSGEVKGTQSSMVLKTGLELHSKNFKKWYSRFSIVALLSMTRNGASTHRGDAVQENITEFGGGVHWYPLTRPSKVYRFIPYGKFHLLVGSSETIYSAGSGANTDSEKLNAGTFGYALGAGMKYYTSRGYGANIGLDFNVRGDSFSADSADTKWVKTNSGPVINIGFLKRF